MLDVQDSLLSRITPGFLAVNERQYFDALNSDWQVHAKAVFPRNDEKFSFMKIEL